MMFPLRAACKCGCSDGYLVTKSGQDCAYCQQCNRHQYNAPKTETGRKQRSVSTTHEAIRPSLRSKVIERANGRCERCGKPASETTTGLHVGHVVSVKHGLDYGLRDDEINSLENLLAECDECNLGHGAGALPIRMFVAILKARIGGEEC